MKINGKRIVYLTNPANEECKALALQDGTTIIATPFFVEVYGDQLRLYERTLDSPPVVRAVGLESTEFEITIALTLAKHYKEAHHG